MIISVQAVNAQKIVIKGKVTDANTNDPVAYASIAVKGTSIGTNTNFDGFFKLEFEKKSDSVAVSSVGYLRKSFFVTNTAEQTINIRLTPSSQTLNEVRITPKSYVNPAWEILKEVVRHKTQNDPRSLSSYQYESYNRIELDANHLSEGLLKKKFINKALTLADSLKISGVDHLPVLPLFLSESVSEFSYRSNPDAKREEIKKTKTNGIGFEDGTLIAQLTGSTFQQYNFYKNFVSAAGKDFVSPVTDSWKSWYDYELEDENALVDGKSCYQISFKPKRPQDLAFTGTIWIARENYAIYRIKATVGTSANINFIHQISIQQQMGGNLTQPWLPLKTRILVEVAQLSSKSTGMLAKFYGVNKNVIINPVFPSDFFKENISVADNVQKPNDQFWDMHRPDSLTVAEKSVYGLIDNIKDIPTVKNYLTIADLLINGYYRMGKISLGPILQSYSYNNVEGNRFRLGFKTNSSFSNRWILGGYVAYGALDKDWKYNGSLDYILSRKHWTEGGINFTHDINQVALLSENYLYQRNNLFSAFTRFGHIDKRKVFFQNIFNLYFRRDIFKGFTEKVTFSNWSLDPLFIFNYNRPRSGGTSNLLTVSELQFETKWAPGSQPIISETFNRPINVKTDVTQPIFTFRYILGLKNVLGSDLSYQKFSVNVSQTLKMGRLGRGRYSLSAGLIPSSVPYPLLENHLGNEIFIYNPNAFNMMHFFEFASDKYASLNYTQHFEGLLLNSVPIVKSFNWRLVGTANILYGGITPANKNNILNNNTRAIRSLGDTPYIEAGYGVENIFKFIRVDFIHRITYRDNISPFYGPAKNFGIKFSAQIRL